jgi:hypothetical protein
MATGKFKPKSYSYEEIKAYILQHHLKALHMKKPLIYIKRIYDWMDFSFGVAIGFVAGLAAAFLLLLMLRHYFIL